MVVNSASHDVYGQDSNKQAEYFVNVPKEVPGTGISSETWYPIDGISTRSNQTFGLWLVPSIVDGWYSVQGFPDKTHAKGHVFHPRFERKSTLVVCFYAELDLASWGLAVVGWYHRSPMAAPSPPYSNNLCPSLTINQRTSSPFRRSWSLARGRVR